MTKTSTKPKGATSYKETAFGIIPRSKLLKLELEGTKKMLTIQILLKLNLPPIEIKAETGLDRKKYLEAMYAADDGDRSQLENLIGNALSESLGKIASETATTRIQLKHDRKQTRI